MVIALYRTGRSTARKMAVIFYTGAPDGLTSTPMEVRPPRAARNSHHRDHDLGALPEHQARVPGRPSSRRADRKITYRPAIRDG